MVVGWESFWRSEKAQGGAFLLDRVVARKAGSSPAQEGRGLAETVGNFPASHSGTPLRVSHWGVLPEVLAPKEVRSRD